MKYPMPESKAAFANLVRRVMREEQLSLVLAAYKVVGELSRTANTAAGVKLACGKGCSFCCHQLVTCTDPEWREIMGYQHASRLFRALRKRCAAFCARWKQYLAARGGRIADDWFKTRLDWTGIPCVFLNEHGGCDVYPVRPMACRAMTSTVRCTMWDKQPGAKQFRWYWEVWAYELIADTRIEGVSAPRAHALPLVHRLLLERNRS